MKKVEKDHLVFASLWIALFIIMLFQLVSISTKPQSDKLYKDEPPKYELEQYDRL